MRNKKEMPFHEKLLLIMYNENKEQPKEFSPSDLLWKIDDPEITERQVREVLDWLAGERRVNTYLGKYKLDRHEFIELRKKDRSVKKELNPKLVQVNQPGKGRKKNYIYNLLFVVLTGAYSYCAYQFMQEGNLNMAEVAVKSKESLSNNLSFENKENLQEQILLLEKKINTVSEINRIQNQINIEFIKNDFLSKVNERMRFLAFMSLMLMGGVFLLFLKR